MTTSEQATSERPPRHRSAASDETDTQRLEREHEQLFHELRAIIPGAQVLFAFMLTVAFTERFRQLSDVQRWVYFVTLMFAALALILLLAPASFHRVRFRRHDKEAMMRVANVEAIAALVMISLSISGTVFLITDVMFSTEAGVVVAVVLWVGTGALWWGLPLSRDSVGASVAGPSPANEPQ